ncbi:MAG: glycosyltransferase [Planctomycetes bacterium]|nr:glycosyltransferase [Planctomycetota bacterium]
MPKKKRFQAERPKPDDPSMELLLKLAQDHPDESAYIVLTGAQKIVILLLLAGGVAWFIADRILFLTVINAILTTFYLVICAFKFYLIHLSLSSTREMEFTEEEIASLTDEDLPVYSILLPLYHETETLKRLVDGLAKLDYPKDKLDVQLLLEEDDVATVEAVENMNMPPFIRAVVTPDSQPKTKPKACNLGLAQARGKYLVIYDGEDRPEPDQLKKAVLGFRRCPDDVICLQAKLNFYNPRQNLLTRWFTTEYSMWFDLFLPGLDHLESPIPLGGTSNHFDIEKLRDLLGWDAFNVTEDCDLGIRISKARYTTRTIDSTTWEEACSDLGYWIRQRSRWTKGYIQTYLVHWRHPFRLARDLGLRQSLGFHLMIGGTPLCLLINPLYWGLTVVWFVWRWETLAQLFPFPIILWALVCLFVGNFVFVYSCMLAAFRRKNYDLVKYGLFVPVYWVLMSIGAWKGFLQLLYKPTYWEKTKHGFDLAKGS